MDPKAHTSDPPVIPGLHYVRPLGSGGFADIGLYESDYPRRQVAVKVMHADVSNPQLAAAFEREADALARVSSHPSILTIHSASVSSDGRPYLVLEYCPHSLGDTFRSSPLSAPQVLDLGVRIGCALETCHRAGILHRDIKPSNLLVTEYGETVVADFGIVGSNRGRGALQSSEQQSPVQQQRVSALSVPWSAPEIVSGKSQGSVGSEVWSLSATLYALLAGYGPFERSGPGANAEDKIVKRIKEARYTPLPDGRIPAQLQQVLAQGMMKDPADRQPSVLALVQQLRGIQQQMGLPVTPLQIPDGPGVSFSAPTGPPGQAQPGHAHPGASTAGAARVRVQVPLASNRRNATKRGANRSSSPTDPGGASSRRSNRKPTATDGQPQEKSKRAQLWIVAGISVAATLLVVAIVFFILGMAG